MKKPFRRAFIEITNGCNLACGFCARSSRPGVSMSPVLFESAAAQAAKLAGVISLHVLGEPLTHPDFPEILRICSRLGLKVNLVTNGVLLGRFPPSLFNENCLSQISISLHALSCLPAAERPREVKRLAEFALSKPPRLIVGFRLRSAGADDFFRETLKVMLAAFGAAANPGADFVKLGEGVFLNFGGLFDWPGAGGSGTEHGCLGLKHHFGILSDGRVVPCCADFDGALTLGDIAERPLAEILSGPGALALRKRIAGGTDMPAYCRSCGFAAPGAADA